uniref:Uncharacterized protein n=1 Tax=Kalanchoe fedtschenkoi TaxID=63787 RepID=A0A7N0R972_KALFE
MALMKRGGRFAMSLALLLSSAMLCSASRMLELESYGSDDGLSCNDGCPVNHCDEDCRPDPTACPACPQNDRRSKKGPGIGGLMPSIGFGIGEGYGVDIPGLGTVEGGFGVGVGVGKGSGSTGYAQGSANGRISVPTVPLAGGEARGSAGP